MHGFFHSIMIVFFEIPFETMRRFQAQKFLLKITIVCLFFTEIIIVKLVIASSRMLTMHSNSKSKMTGMACEMFRNGTSTGIWLVFTLWKFKRNQNQITNNEMLCFCFLWCEKFVMKKIYWWKCKWKCREFMAQLVMWCYKIKMRGKWREHNICLKNVPKSTHSIPMYLIDHLEWDEITSNST